MSRPSVYLIEFRNSRGLRLAGQLFPTDAEAPIVVFAHGFASDQSSRGRFPRVAAALGDAGIASLTFDFSGCGESDDDSLTADKEVDDLRAAVAFAAERGFAQIGLYGHSLGGVICLRAYSSQIAAIAVSGAATGPMHYEWHQYFSAEQLRDVTERGALRIHPADGPRREIVVTAQMLSDFAEIQPATLLGAIRCPVLVIHGTGDGEERQLLAHSTAGMPLLPPTSRLEVIAGAPHSFEGYHDRVVESVRSWFVQQLLP